MPCFSGQEDQRFITTVEKKSHGLKIDQLAACICGVLTQLSKDENLDVTLNSINWNEVGVTKAQFDRWWRYHKKEDTLRRHRERLKAAELKNRESGLAKLTEDEKKALGLLK